MSSLLVPLAFLSRLLVLTGTPPLTRLEVVGKLLSRLYESLVGGGGVPPHPPLKTSETFLGGGGGGVPVNRKERKSRSSQRSGFLHLF